MLTKQGKVYGAKYAGLAQKKYQEAMQIMQANGAGHPVKKGEFMAQPYAELCGIMARDIGADYGKAMSDLASKVDKKYYAAMEALGK